MNWPAALDFDRALSNVHSDIAGDWYRDPWGWPEYQYQVDNGFLGARARCLASNVRKSAKIDVPKEGFATRPAVVMEPLDRLAYQALVDRQSKRLIGDLDLTVFGWRLDPQNPVAGNYARNDREWERYRGYLSRSTSAADFGLKTDVVSCFASIPVGRLIEAVGARGGSRDIINRIGSYIEGWDAIPGRSGLAQRSSASAVLANLYLHRLDEPLRAYSAGAPTRRADTGGVSARFTRWMDDIWAFGEDEGRLRTLQIALQEVARDAGLELHAAKTKLLSGEELAKEALKIEHSAVDDALIDNPPDLTPLEELVDRLILSPESAERTSIHFATTRLRRQKLPSRVAALLDVADRMPQGADHLARLARDARAWQGRQDWFLDYVASDWACIEWSVAQLGTMFPSSNKPQDSVINWLESRLQQPRNILMTALITQRLAAWDQDRARATFRANLDSLQTPMERRLVALAALAAGEERKWIADALSEYEENAVVLDLIRDRAWMPVSAVSDFAS